MTQSQADSSSGTTATAELASAHASDTQFDLKNAPIPSFGSLVAARAAIFKTRQALESFKRTVDSLGATGEEGRRKGLGHWMVARFEEAAKQLASYEKDDVASFTRANALMTLNRPAEALPIYTRLSNAYPKEPRPRGGMLEAQLEVDLQKGDPETAAAKLRKGIESAGESFADSAECHYLGGRAAELERKSELALDEYSEARSIDPTLRANLFRFAHLSERCGLDEQALDCYETLARLLPIDRAVLFNLGVLYEDLGRDLDAAACYELLDRNDPTDQRSRLYLVDAREGIDMYYDEDLERKEDRLNQILRTPITDFELSVRARNCLNKMNIVTLGDLVKLSEQELLSYKNFGETSLNEIKEILTQKNLRLGMKHEEAVASVDSTQRTRATGENAEVLNRPIADLDLSIRARRTVENLGCLTVGEIAQHSEEELLSMPNFGVTSLQELKRKLADMGIKLAEGKTPTTMPTVAK